MSVVQFVHGYEQFSSKKSLSKRMIAWSLKTVHVSTYTNGEWGLKITDEARSFVTDDNHSTTGTVVERDGKSMNIFGQALNRSKDRKEKGLTKRRIRTAKTSGSRLMATVVCSAIALPWSSKSVDDRNLVQTRIIKTSLSKDDTNASRNRLINPSPVEQGKRDLRFDVICCAEHRALFVSWQESKSYHSDWWASFLKITGRCSRVP